MKKSVCLLFLYFLSCTNKVSKQPLKVTVLAGNKIEISRIDIKVLQDLRQDSLTAENWQTILPIYKMPKDTDMKDYAPPQPGQYFIKDSTLVFTADTPFKKNTAYYARLYQLYDNGTALNILQDKWKHRNPQYIECTFKP